MGYYTGSGVVVSGGETVSLKESTYWYGEHNVYQKTRTTVTVKNGVSLSTAQGLSASISMDNQTWTSGMVSFISHNCKGSQTNVTYSRINDSNLYTVSSTVSTISAQDGLGWSPTGWQS